MLFLYLWHRFVPRPFSTFECYTSAEKGFESRSYTSVVCTVHGCNEKVYNFRLRVFVLCIFVKADRFTCRLDKHHRGMFSACVCVRVPSTSKLDTHHMLYTYKVKIMFASTYLVWETKNLPDSSLLRFSINGSFVPSC